MQTSKYLWVLGSVIFGLLGILHLILTFFTNSFSPRDQKLISLLTDSNPKLSADISIWKAWIGFNASHSIGILFIATINAIIALKYFDLAQKNDFYFIFSIFIIAFYVFLAARYWFMPPLIGTSITLLCYLVAFSLTKV